MERTKRPQPNIILAECCKVLLEQLDYLTAEAVSRTQGDAQLLMYNEMTLVRDAYKPVLEDLIRRGR